MILSEVIQRINSRNSLLMIAYISKRNMIKAISLFIFNEDIVKNTIFLPICFISNISIKTNIIVINRLIWFSGILVYPKLIIFFD